MKRLMAAGLEEGDIMVGEPNGREPMRDISAQSRKWIWPHGVSQKTRSKLHE